MSVSNLVPVWDDEPIAAAPLPPTPRITGGGPAAAPRVGSVTIDDVRLEATTDVAPAPELVTTPFDDGGGSYAPAAAAIVVEQTLHPEQSAPTRLVSPPERFDPTERVARPSAFSVDLSSDDADMADADWRAERSVAIHEDLPEVDYDLLRRRDIAKELLRDRLVRMAEQRHQRSAYEIAFILLAFAVAVLLAAPPLVQVLLAARGIQA